MAKPDSIEYVYEGSKVLVLDDHNPDYEIDFVKGDKFRLSLKADGAVIEHEDAPGIKFEAAFIDKKYKRLMKYSSTTEFHFVPHSRNPAYPQLTQVNMKIVPKLYDYYNKLLFNGACPRLVVFRDATKTPRAVGLAEMAHRSSGKVSYRLSLLMDRIKHDPFLFVDVLLHEMVHLYLMKHYVDTGDIAYVNAEHGPLFQKEVNRINAKGYNLDVVLAWEKREAAVAKDYYVIGIHFVDKKQHIGAWSLLKPTVKDLDKILDQVRSDWPEYRMQATVYRTTDPKYRSSLGELVRGFNVKNRISNLTYFDNLTDILNSDIKEPAAVRQDVKIKLSRRDMKYLVQTYDEYVDAVNRHLAYDYGSAEAAWNSTPIKEVDKLVTDMLKTAYSAIKRGMNEREVRNTLKDVPKHYMPRYPYSDYRKHVLAIIKANKLNGLEDYRELQL